MKTELDTFPVAAPVPPNQGQVLEAGPQSHFLREPSGREEVRGGASGSQSSAPPVRGPFSRPTGGECGDNSLLPISLLSYKEAHRSSEKRC